MRLRQILILMLLVIMPLALLAWLGARVARSEREEVQRTFDELLRGRLQETDRTLTGLLEERGRAIEQALADRMPNGEERFALCRSLPWVQQFFAQAADGTVEVPSPDEGLSQEEGLFLERCRPLFDQKLLLTPPADSMQGADGSDSLQATAALQFQPEARSISTAPAPMNQYTTPDEKPTRFTRTPQPVLQQSLEQTLQQDVYQQQQFNPNIPPSFKRVVDRLLSSSNGSGNQKLIAGANSWYPYYWGHDLRLLYVVKASGGSVRGAEISRSRVIADLIGRIAEPKGDDPILREGSMLLTDSGGRPLYRWGGYLPPAGSRPRLQVSLSSPLHHWSVLYFVAPAFEAARLSGSGTSAWGLSLLAVGIALAGLALILYREQQRELSEAAQRVSFVNQVSHELKTPLTNIRLHAELLEQELPEEDEQSRRRIEVVISESQRLGRLIGNVLTFSRQQRDRVALRLIQAVPDETVRRVLERFSPALSGRKVIIERSLAASQMVQIDQDVLEQILNNLLSNVEKYAAGGGHVLVATRQNAQLLLLIVRDRGPGIPADKAEFVFQPFARLNDALSEGVSGAGIGLSISRELARRHGGELSLDNDLEGLSERFQIPELAVGVGACFLATLKTTR